MMDSFKTWTKSAFSYLSPEAEENMRIGYIAGLRRAAEIATHEYDVGSAIQAIESEAARIEGKE